MMKDDISKSARLSGRMLMDILSLRWNLREVNEFLIPSMIQTFHNSRTTFQGAVATVMATIPGLPDPQPSTIRGESQPEKFTTSN